MVTRDSFFSTIWQVGGAVLLIASCAVKEVKQEIETTVEENLPECTEIDKLHPAKSIRIQRQNGDVLLIFQYENNKRCLIRKKEGT